MRPPCGCPRARGRERHRRADRDSADVSLRTFFNYFSSKEEAVVAGDAVRGEMLVDEFRSRPASESVLTALEAAVVVFVDDLVGSGRGSRCG